MKSQESEDRLLAVGSPPKLLSSTAVVMYELPGWVHYIWLIYLGFLFAPALEPHNDGRWLWPTLISMWRRSS